MFKPLLSLACLLMSFAFESVSGQLCSTGNGLGKCSSNVFNCVFQNGYPNYFKANASTGDCAQDEFCCLNLARPEDGSCAQRCGVSGTARQKVKPSSDIKLDKNYDWEGLSTGAQERSSRIVNGSDTDKYEFCWQGGVFVVDTEQLQNNSRNAVPIYIGGASLVGQDMALTAAHVLQPFITNANFIIFVAFGFRDIRDVTDIMNQTRNFNADETPVFRVPNEMAFHSGYNDRTYENNVAIIRFNPLSCDTSNICPICLSPVPANPFQPWKGTCFTSGWGATENSSVATVLQKLEMVIPYPNECIKSFMKLGLKNYDMPSTMLCADSAAGPGQRGGTCDRDGGSPLVCQTKYGNWELTGIVGVGINRCRQIPAPTLFTNVGYYFEWIQSYTSGAYQNTDSPSTAPSTVASTTPLTLLANTDVTPPLLTATTTTSTSNTTFNSTTTVTNLNSRFQFSPPKVFLPRPAPALNEQQKKVLAFFQERTDDSSPRTPAQVVSQSPLPQETTSTAAPSTTNFSVLLNASPKKPFDDTITGASSGAVKFFMTAGDGMIRRKQADTFQSMDSRNIVIPIVQSSSTSTTSTMEPSTTPSTSPSTATETVTVTTTTTDASTTTTPIEKTTRTTPESLSNSISNSNSISKTNGGWNKIVFKIRPNQDNPSILALLRERYKNSKLYTDAPANATEATAAKPTTSTKAPASVSSSTTSIFKVVTNPTPISSRIKMVISTPHAESISSATTDTPKAATTIGTTSLVRPVTVIISGAQLANLQATLANMLRNETLQRRPIGNSVMM